MDQIRVCDSLGLLLKPAVIPRLHLAQKKQGREPLAKFLKKPFVPSIFCSTIAELLLETPEALKHQSRLEKKPLGGISLSLDPAKTSGQKLDEMSDPPALTETNDEQQNDILVPLPLMETKQEQQDDVSDLLAPTETIEEHDILVPLPLIETKQEKPDVSDLLALTETIVEKDNILFTLPLIEIKEEQQNCISDPLAVTKTEEEQQDGISGLLALTECKEERQDIVKLASSPAGGMAIHKQQPKMRAYGPSPLKKQGLGGISYSLAPAKTSVQKLDEMSDPLALTETNDKQQNYISIPMPLIETKQEQQDDVSDLLAPTETIEEHDILVPLPLIETKEEQQDDVNSELLASSPAGGMAIPKQQPKLRVYGPSLRIIKKPPNIINPIVTPPVDIPLTIVVDEQQNKPVTGSEKPIRLLNIGLCSPTTSRKTSSSIAAEEIPVINNLRVWEKKMAKKGKIIKSLRKIIRDLRKQADVINGIQSPALKSLVLSLAANKRIRHRSKRRWPESVKAVAYNIYKTSSSAVYKYISEVFQLPNTKTVRYFRRFSKNTEIPPLLTQKNTKNENAITERLLKRMDKMFESPVEDTRKPLNMRILIKGDSNVGKSCLLQRLQGGPFMEEYVPSEQTQIAPIHWKHENSDYKVHAEVWDIVDKGQCDNTSRDVYKEASGVILMMDITKPRSLDYVVKELAQIPGDLPVVVLGNQCDQRRRRQVPPRHVNQLLRRARLDRTGPVRYTESSMRNGFGLRLLHKFLSVPFLRLQRVSLLEQLQRCQRDAEDMEREMDDFQNSEEADYRVFLERLGSKRRDERLREATAKARQVGDQSQQTGDQSQQADDQSQQAGEQSQQAVDQTQQNGEQSQQAGDQSRLAGDQSRLAGEQSRQAGEQSRQAGEQALQPSGHSLELHEETHHPLEPPTEVSQSFKPRRKKRKAETSRSRESKKQYYPEMMKPRNEVSVETTPSEPVRQQSEDVMVAEGGTFDDFYPDDMDSNFLVDFTVAANQEQRKKNSDTANQDLEETFPANRVESTHSKVLPVHINSNQGVNTRLKRSLALGKIDYVKKSIYHKGVREHPASQSQPSLSMPSLDNELLACNTGAKRMLEGRKSPNVAETLELRTKKKPKEKGVFSQKSPRAKLDTLISVKKSSRIPRGGDEYMSFEQYEF